MVKKREPSDRSRPESGSTTADARIEVKRKVDPSPLDTARGNARNSADYSAIKFYLQEIGQVPLLTVEKEITLAKQMKQGEEDTRNLMIESNLRLVVKIAQDYANFAFPCST